MDVPQGYNRLMLAVPREGPYRFFFYTGDREEPPHVHVRRENRVGKFWLDPVRLERSGGLQRPEIRRIARIIEQHHALLLGTWNEHFDH